MTLIAILTEIETLNRQIVLQIQVSYGYSARSKETLFEDGWTYIQPTPTDNPSSRDRIN